MDDNEARKEFLALPVKTLQQRVEKDQENEGKGGPKPAARRVSGRVPVTAASLVVRASKYAFGNNALKEADVLPVDKYLLSQYLVRKRIRGDGWCYARALLEKQEAEPTKIRDKHHSPTYESKEAVMAAIADELQLNWEYYAQFMDTSYMLLDDNDEIKKALIGVRNGEWNQAIGDAMPMAGGKVFNRIQRLFVNNFMHDVHFRQMDLNVPVWELVNVGDHWDVGVDVSKTTTITQIMTEFLPLYERIATGDIDVVLAEVAMNQFPEQFAKTEQRWFSVRMRDNTYRTAPFGTLNVVPRLSAMIYNIERLQFVKEIKERCFEQKGDSLEVFYLCLIMDDSEKAVGMEKYVSRQVLARNHLADQVVRSYDNKHVMPTVKQYVNPAQLPPKKLELWITRVKWMGPRSLLPDDWPMETSPSAQQPSSASTFTGSAEGAPNAAEVTSIQQASSAAASTEGKIMYPGAEGAPPEAMPSELTNSHLSKMADILAMGACKEAQEKAQAAQAQEKAAQEALAAERLKNAELAKMFDELKKAQDREREEAAQQRERYQAEAVRILRENQRACSHCGMLSTDTKSTSACCVAECINWTHVVDPCGVVDANLFVYCRTCFQKFCVATYSEDKPVPSGGDNPYEESNTSALDERSDASGTIAEHRKARAAKYTFAGVINTPQSPATWYSQLQMRKMDVIRQGTITADGVQLHAFTSYKSQSGASKILNIAMVTPVAADSERRAVSVMLSWLNLDYKELDFSKCTKYSMPRDVKAAINSAAFPRPKNSSPFPLLTSQKEKSQKRKHAKSVLSADEGEGDDSADERESLAAKKKREKDAREIRDLKKKLDDAEAALAAAAASKTVTVTSKIASKPAADSNQPSALLQPSLLVEFAVRY